MVIGIELYEPPFSVFSVFSNRKENFQDETVGL